MGINAVLVGSRGTTSTTSLTTGAGTTSASGSTFVYLTSFDATATANTPTDSKGNTYVQKSVTLASGTGDKCQVWVCENGTGGASHTASQTYSANAFAVGYLVEITGATTTPTDIAVNGIDAATPFTISTGTLAQANEVVITICMCNQSVSGTNTYSSSNSTILDQEPNGAAFWTSAVSKLITSSTAAVSPSFTDTQGTAAAMIAVSFKEGTSTTTSPVTGPALSPMLGNKALGPLGLAGFALKVNIANSIVAGSGTSALVFGQSGTLTGSGALAGTAALTFGQTGTLTQPGLQGTAALTFGQSGVPAGAGALTGSSALLFGQSGTLAAAGVLAGASALAFAQTAILAASGALTGTAALTFGQSGTSSGDGALAGTSALTFGASATPDQPQGALSGTASMAMGSAAVLAGDGLLAGLSALQITAIDTGTAPIPAPSFGSNPGGGGGGGSTKFEFRKRRIQTIDRAVQKALPPKLIAQPVVLASTLAHALSSTPAKISTEEDDLRAISLLLEDERTQVLNYLSVVLKNFDA